MNLCFKCRKPVDFSYIDQDFNSILGHSKLNLEKSEVPQPKHGLHTQCFSEWFGLEASSKDFENIYMPKNAFYNSNYQEKAEAFGHQSKTQTQTPGLYQNTFFHGNFKKYSATLWGKEYILKLSDEHKELAKVEYLCNILAHKAGLDVPKHYLIKFMNQEDCFVSYNFMQDHTGADLQHIYHFVGGAEKYNIEELMKVIESKTERLPQIIKFINLCLFDALIGNNDRHGRNLAFIVTPNNYVLSPCYDNPSYFGTEDEFLLGAELSPKCSIATYASNEPMIKDYVVEFIRLGYREEVHKFASNINLLKFQQIIEESFLSVKRRQSFLRFVNHQYKELLNGVSQ